MNLIAVSIRRPVFAWILMSAMIIFGSIALSRLGVSQLPDVDFPVINISVSNEGASPEVVESELVDPIEQALLAVEGVSSMKSSASQGSGRVTLEFDIDKNVDVALQEVQSSLSQVRLPPGVDFPIVRKQNPEEDPILMLSVFSKDEFGEMMKWTDTYLVDQFRFLEGIGEVSIAGFATRNVRVWPDLEKLKRAELSILDIVNSLNSQHLESAAGRIETPKTEFRLRWMGEASSIEEIRNLKILQRGGQVIQDRTFRIGDVAEVEDGLSDIRRVAKMEGQNAIMVSIKKQRGFNEVTLSEKIRERIEQIQKQLPDDYNVRVRVDFTRPTKAVVDTTFEKLWMAALVTIVVCFLFLGSWQSALNILFSIPTSILGTFIILYFAGFTLNLFSLLALTLAISIVVDDAIMLLENIVRHFRMGKSGTQAAYDGAMEVLPAATAATFAVVAVFLPVIFMSGITGKFFFQFGVTMSAAVLLSLVEAITITPMRAAALLGNTDHSSRLEMWLDQLFHRIAEGYRSLLNATLRWPKTVVLVSMILFGISMALFETIRKEFVPPQDQNILLLSGSLPPGTALASTEIVAKQVEEIVLKNKNVESYMVSIGGFGGGDVNSIFLPMNLIPREKRKQTHLEIIEDLRAQLKDVKGFRSNIRDISARNLTTGRQFPISFTLFGADLTVLKEKADEISEKLTTAGLVRDMDTDFKLGLPEIKIIPDRERMAQMGVSIDAVAGTLSVALAGIRQNRFTADSKRIDVRVKVREVEMADREKVGELRVRNAYGVLIPLKNFVKLEEVKSYQGINRLNRQRAVGVYGGLAPGKSQAAVLGEVERLSKEVLPPGYTFRLDGASAGLQESFKSLAIALLLGILVAYMILAIQFNSFVHPISVLMALPFSLTGAFLALEIFDVSLNLFSFIGIIVLMGIAKKNSIMLVEFANQLRHKGEKMLPALLEAGAVRLRPILMTSAATVLAATPLVVGNSMGQETRTPMGLTIIGGTLVSTVFTLFVVPCIYILLSRFERSFKQIDLKS